MTGMAAREKEVEHMISSEEKSENCLLLTESVEREVQPMVVVLSWHRAYGEALLYAQSDRAVTLISKAEQRIFERYLEVAASSSSLLPEEGRDLWNATMTLSQLKRTLGKEGIRHVCKLCGSVYQKQFSAEMRIHFPELKDIDKPVVWLFPEVVVCLDCGTAEFTVPKAELRQLAKGDAAAAAGLTA
jgi:hypothetical protein